MGCDFPEPNLKNGAAYTIAVDWFGQGAARYAFKGVANYDIGVFKKGDKVVAKKFTDKHAMLVTDWDAQVKTEEKALEIAEAWNEANYIDKIFEVVQSSSAQCVGQSTETVIKMMNI